jgi:hypothetical protein
MNIYEMNIYEMNIYEMNIYNIYELKVLELFLIYNLKCLVTGKDQIQAKTEVVKEKD